MSDESTYKIVLETLKEFQPSYVAVFGSRARGDHRADSDLDLLVDFKRYPNLFQIVDMRLKLSKILGFPVDLITRASLSDLIKPYVYKDLIVIMDE
jgi:hypothetical protein